jgi:predicted unusual protein kinase regulating ubiquinone biosynthesis (AarF/ABC1/UbiB family)
LKVARSGDLGRFARCAAIDQGYTRPWAYLLPSANTKLLEEASGQFFDRFWGMSMNELRNIQHDDMMKFGLQFRELMLTMPFQLPENLLLLGRTLGILSGMCTGLNSDFNLWMQLAPYAKKLTEGEGGSLRYISE